MTHTTLMTTINQARMPHDHSNLYVPDELLEVSFFGSETSCDLQHQLVEDALGRDVGDWNSGRLYKTCGKITQGTCMT